MRKTFLSMSLALLVLACAWMPSADARPWRRGGYYYYGPAVGSSYYAYPGYTAAPVVTTPYPGYTTAPAVSSYYYAPGYSSYYYPGGGYYYGGGRYRGWRR
jgi:hypothetical protein